MNLMSKTNLTTTPIYNAKKKNFDKEQEILKKANNTNSVRVLYKKTGQAPKVKFINNIMKLKTAIVNKNLDIIPYETLYIICTNRKKQNKTKCPNIILDFYSIAGDLILIDIDKKKREFKSLSQEDIILYTQDLINKSANIQPSISYSKKANSKQVSPILERDFEGSRTSPEYFNNFYKSHVNNKSTFEKTLINVLTNLELVLVNILKNNQNGGKKNG